jgi:hypothetical protein
MSKPLTFTLNFNIPKTGDALEAHLQAIVRDKLLRCNEPETIKVQVNILTAPEKRKRRIKASFTVKGSTDDKLVRGATFDLLKDRGLKPRRN